MYNTQHTHTYIYSANWQYLRASQTWKYPSSPSLNGPLLPHPDTRSHTRTTRGGSPPIGVCLCRAGISCALPGPGGTQHLQPQLRPVALWTPEPLNHLLLTGWGAASILHVVFCWRCFFKAFKFRFYCFIGLSWKTLSVVLLYLLPWKICLLPTGFTCTWCGLARETLPFRTHLLLQAPGLLPSVSLHLEHHLAPGPSPQFHFHNSKTQKALKTGRFLYHPGGKMWQGTESREVQRHRAEQQDHLVTTVWHRSVQ